MKLMLIFLTILIILVTINFQLNIGLKYDLFNNSGRFKVKLFGFLPLIFGSFSIEENLIKIKKKDEKFININLKISKKQMNFLKELQKNISTKIYVKDLTINSLICLENPAIVCLISGFLNIVISMFFIKFKENNYDICLQNNLDTGFRQNNVKIELETTIYTSLIDIIWAFLITLINNRRSNDEKRRKTEC